MGPVCYPPRPINAAGRHSAPRDAGRSGSEGGADPAPGAGEVRIRVRAAGINFADVLARLGLYPDAPKPPCVVGYEVAGRVDGVGASVTGFHDGDRVVGLTRFGGYADVVTVPPNRSSTFRTSSAIRRRPVPVNYLTAALALAAWPPLRRARPS